MDCNVFKTEIGGREVTVETGKYAGQANGSCIIRCGDTVVMTNVTMADAPRPGMDYFPLGVDFEEKLYAIGKFPAVSSVARAEAATRRYSRRALSIAPYARCSPRVCSTTCRS